MQLGLLVIRGCLPLLPFICDEMSLLGIMFVVGFQFQIRSFLFDLPFDLNWDFDFSLGNSFDALLRNVIPAAIY